MIGKLLKHEFIRTRGIIGVVVGAALAAIALGCALMAFRIPVLNEFGVVLGLLPVIVLVPALQIILAVDFWRSSFRSEGYLTHAIPVKGSTIYWTKLGWAMIVTAVALVIDFLLLALVWFVVGTTLGAAFFDPDPNLFAVVGEVLRNAGQVVPVPVLYGLVIPLLLIGVFFMWPVFFMFVATVGSEGRFGRMGAGGPIVVAIVAWIAWQVAAVISLAAVPFGLDMSMIERGGAPEFVHYGMAQLIAADPDSEVMPLGMFAGMAIMIVVFLWLSRRSWNKKVELN